MKIRTIIILCLGINCLVANAQDSREWRGPGRDGVYTAENMLSQWPEEGPELLWSTDELPEGLSSLCVVDSTIFTTGKRDSLDVCIALRKGGGVLWESDYGRSWDGSYPNAKCTPVYKYGKLYVSSGFGDIACLDALTGEIIWQVQGSEKWRIKFCTWGITESLLVVDDMVIFNPIGEATTTVALNAESGEVIWESRSIRDSASYCSPLLVRYAEKDMMINVASSTIYGLDVANGEILWTYNYFDIHTPLWHPRAPIINCNTPIFQDGRIYVSSGYNHCGVMLELNEDGRGVELVWADTTLDTHHGGLVKVGESIYGSNWLSNSSGNWVCLDWKTGEVKWEENWHNKGVIIAVNDYLILYDDRRGYVGMLEANPEGFNLIGSFRVPLGRGPHWSHPVICDGVLYIRHNNALMAYKLIA